MRPVRCAALLVLLAAWAAPAAPAGGEPVERPNVLLIVTDDQRPGTMSVMPQTRYWFKKRGTRFPNGFVTTPLCCPSRATIMTGRYAHNHGVTTTAGAHNLDPTTTVQHRLKGAGYQTAMAGKYLNQWEGDPPSFDRWATLELSHGGNGYSPSYYNVDGTVRETTTYSTTYIRQKAIEFLKWFEKDDERPWFLYVPVYAPHAPATPAPKYRNAPVPAWKQSPAVQEFDRSDKPPWVQATDARGGPIEAVRARQLRTLMSVDDMVARLMGALREAGERKDTLALFLSDNGHLWGEHGLFAKRYPYSASIGVPLFARWHGHVAPGATDDRLVANVDVAPTILEAAGLASTGVDGRSLLDPWERDRVFAEYALDEGYDVPAWATLRTLDLQYTEHYDDEGAMMFREYYDLEGDPWQLVNVLGDGDPSNDPPSEELEALWERVRQDAVCVGTAGSGACP